MTLRLRRDRRFGVVYTSLSRNADVGLGVSPGVDLGATSPWKVALFDTSFDHASAEQGADGIVHISAEEVAGEPLITLLPPEAPTKAVATWLVQSWQDDSGDPDAVGFPDADFVVELTAYLKPGEGEVTLDLVATPLGTNPDVSVYSLELRTAVATVGSRESQILAAPWFMGSLVPRPLDSPLVSLVGSVSEVRLSDPVIGVSVPTHPGVMSMQWMAFYDESDPDGDLLFWGTEDEEAQYVKPYLVYPEDDELAFGVQHYPPNNLTDTGPASMPFDVVMAPLQGTWYDAAAHYRTWVKGLTSNTAFLPKQTATDPGSPFSSIVRDADAVGVVLPAHCAAEPLLKEHSNFQFWAAESDDLAERFGLESILARPWFWDWNSFSANVGEWFNGEPGASPVRADFTDNAPVGDPARPWAPYFHALDLSSSPGSGFFYSYVTGYQGVPAGLLYTVRDEFGLPRTSSFSFPPQTSQCASAPSLSWVKHDLCPGTLFPLAYTLHVLNVLRSEGLGLGGVFLDEYHTGEALCYDTTHEHAPGGGTYFVAGKQNLLSFIKAHMRATGLPEFFLWTEGPSEAYLRWVELCWSHYGGIGGLEIDQFAYRAPLYQTVYNEYQRFANRDTVNSPDFIFDLDNELEMSGLRLQVGEGTYECAEVGVGTILSDQLLSTNLVAHPLQELLAELVASCVDVFTHPTAGPVVRFGERLRDPALDVGSALFDGPQAEGSPLIFASAYRGGDVDLGVLLVNWTHAGDTVPVSSGQPGTQAGFAVQLDLAGAGLAPTGTYELVPIEPPGTPVPISWSGEGMAEVIVPVLPEISAAFYEVRGSSQDS
ncbi:MAG: DUF6259 domain-containing protein [Planctomycetota bacterium]